VALQKHNILIDPLHPDASKIKATKVRKWLKADTVKIPGHYKFIVFRK
jgi:hypothetical protein